MIHEPIIDQCLGCSKIITGPEPGPSTCSVYMMPFVHWRFNKICPMATHIQKKFEKKGFVDPLKKSKQMAKGKK